MATYRPAADAPRRRTRASAFGKAVEQRPAPSRRAEPEPSDDLVQAFIVRTGRALARIAERMPRERLVQAVSAETDTDVLFRSLREGDIASVARAARGYGEHGA